MREREKPKVSVIIPLYNKVNYIKRAIDSVLAQTEDDFELIVINDGSTDGSDTIISEYDDSRILFVNQKNQGVSATRNRGVMLAQARLISFLDADDEWDPHFLETMLKLTHKYPNSGLYGCIQNYNNKNKRLINHTCNLEQDTGGTIIWSAKSEKSYYYYCAVSGEHPITSSGILMKKEVFSEYGGFNSNMIFYEDWDLWDKIAYKYNICTTTENLSKYHIECTNAKQRILKSNNEYKMPFEEYLSRHFDTTRDEIYDIKLYIESLNIEKAIISEHYNKKESLKYLLNIHSKELFVKKCMVILAIILPYKYRNQAKEMLFRIRSLIYS